MVGTEVEKRIGEDRMKIVEEIKKWKQKKNAVILAHYYVNPEIQEIADYIGDSFYLSKVAVGLKEQTIIFCGVSFMGESAKILNPKKTVLMPDLTADCAMAHMADAETIQKMREKYEDLAVVCYINSTAELNLARYVAEQVPEKEFVFNNGYCPVHEHMQLEEIKKVKEQHPQAEILTHPECPEAVCAISDYIGSTSGIIAYAAKSSCKEFIVCTENGVRYELEKQNPDKKFYFAGRNSSCVADRRK